MEKMLSDMVFGELLGWLFIGPIGLMGLIGPIKDGEGRWILYFVSGYFIA